jgi:hypothetical protein
MGAEVFREANRYSARVASPFDIAGLRVHLRTPGIVVIIKPAWSHSA